VVQAGGGHGAFGANVEEILTAREEQQAYDD